MTYDEDTTGISDQAICEAAGRFRRGLVVGQSKTFAPSIAEFITEARRIDDLIPYRNRVALPAPEPQRASPTTREDRIRMRFKLDVLSAAMAVGRPHEVERANDQGLDQLIALAAEWGVPVPDELRKAA